MNERKKYSMANENMLTVDDIIKNAEPHPFRGKKYTKVFGNIILSVVGGSEGLYGDFENSFEVALINIKNNKFVTRNFYACEDDVLAWVDKEELQKIINLLEGVPSPKTGVVEAGENLSAPKVNES